MVTIHWERRSEQVKTVTVFTYSTVPQPDTSQTSSSRRSLFQNKPVTQCVGLKVPAKPGDSSFPACDILLTQTRLSTKSLCRSTFSKRGNDVIYQTIIAMSAGLSVSEEVVNQCKITMFLQEVNPQNESLRGTGGVGGP